MCHISSFDVANHFWSASLGLLPPANEVCEVYVFTPVCHSVHRGEVSRPRPSGDVGGSGREVGVSRPRPMGEVWGGGVWPGGPGPHPRRVSRPRPRGCIPACTEADTPQQTPTAAAVRILLECILVVYDVGQSSKVMDKNH